MTSTETSNSIVIDEKTTSTSIVGLGDVVKLFTSLLGLDTCKKCEERRKKLNKQFSFVREGNVISDSDIDFVQSLSNTLTEKEQIRILEIYNSTFSQKQELCHCPGLFKAILEKLSAQIDRQNKRLPTSM